MIHIFIGTKAQYVKTAPIIQELDKRNIAYNLIDSGQHASLSKHYREYFHIRNPDRFLRKANEDIITVGSLFVWMSKTFFKILFYPKKIFNDLFQGQRGVCLIHGDTPTTLLSVLAAKRVGIKVAHLESGLRSHSFFHPFPEEIIRAITMRLSDYLFAPSQWAFDNLNSMNVKGAKHLISGNTNIDALNYMLNQNNSSAQELGQNEPFVLVSIHRAETILNKKRLTSIVKLIQSMSEKNKVLFCMHPPTKKQMEKYNLISRLESLEKVSLSDLLPYPEFIQAMRTAHYIVTDGGSIQEESYYLNIPCLLMRNRTERTEGLQQNVCVSEFDPKKITYFLDHLDSYRTSEYQKTNQAPSKDIVNILLQEFPANKKL